MTSANKCFSSSSVIKFHYKYDTCFKCLKLISTSSLWWSLWSLSLSSSSSLFSLITTKSTTNQLCLFNRNGFNIPKMIIFGLCLMTATATGILANDELGFKEIQIRKRIKQAALKVPPCDAGYFQCDSGDFCVKQQYNCDDNEDCPDGSDESNCTDKYDSSYYNKLFSKRPDEDREKFTVNCSLTFVPFGCTCSDRNMFCVNRHLEQIPTATLPAKITVLDLSGNRISIIRNSSFTRKFKPLKSLIMTSNNIHTMQPESFYNLTELTHLHLVGNQLQQIYDHMFVKNKKLLLLNLSYNQIKIIGPHAFDGLNELIELDLRSCQLIELSTKMFSTLHNLELLWLQRNQISIIYPDALINLHNLDTLSLAHNQLTKLNKTIFNDLTILKSLSLAYNKIIEITDHQFDQMTSLTKLDLSFNQIETIGPKVFIKMHQLRSLTLQGNNLKKLPQNIFSELDELTHIYFSNFRMCTYALKVRVCTPRGDGISSLQHLLDNVILRVAVWVVAFIAMIGNCLVIIGRMMMHELNVVHSFFIKNLAMADLLMGIYLLIIAYYDIKFRNHYILHEEEWRHSWQCTFAGVISTISTEASVFILAIITIDRYLSVMHPFSIKRHSMTFAVLAMFSVWTMSIVLALMPIIAKSYFVNPFYSNNGVCLGLEIHEGSPLGYSTFLFCGLNSTAFMLIMYAYVKMSMAIMNSAIGLRTTQQQQDRNIAKRCAFIVATDGICWLPIVIIKLAAISGIPINQDLYAWVAVFLLPVNSALNPVLYTLTTKLFKQQLNRIITHNFSTSIIHRRNGGDTVTDIRSSNHNKSPRAHGTVSSDGCYPNNHHHHNHQYSSSSFCSLDYSNHNSPNNRKHNLDHNTLSVQYSKNGNATAMANNHNNHKSANNNQLMALSVCDYEKHQRHHSPQEQQQFRKQFTTPGTGTSTIQYSRFSNAGLTNINHNHGIKSIPDCNLTQNQAIITSTKQRPASSNDKILDRVDATTSTTSLTMIPPQRRMTTGQLSVSKLKYVIDTISNVNHINTNNNNQTSTQPKTYSLCIWDQPLDHFTKTIKQSQPQKSIEHLNGNLDYNNQHINCLHQSNDDSSFL